MKRKTSAGSSCGCFCLIAQYGSVHAAATAHAFVFALEVLHNGKALAEPLEVYDLPLPQEP